MKLNLKQKSMDLLVQLFLKVMRSAVKRWRQRSQKQDPKKPLAGLPLQRSETSEVKEALAMLAIDVLLELTRLLIDQAQAHVSELEQ